LGGGRNCNYSIYSDGTREYKVYFVEQDTNVPENEFFDLGDNSGILIQNGGNGLDLTGLDGLLILVGEL
jgi:hypothetical protein